MGENSRIQSTSIEGSLFLYCIPKLLRLSYGQIALSYAKLRSGFHASVNCYLPAPPKVKKKRKTRREQLLGGKEVEVEPYHGWLHLYMKDMLIVTYNSVLYAVLCLHPRNSVSIALLQESSLSGICFSSLFLILDFRFSILVKVFA